MTFNDPLLRQELRDLWASLQSDRRFAGKLAGPFFGHAPETFSQAETRILYIGKATGGKFDEPDASEQAFGCNRKMFWSFARRLGRLTGYPNDPLANIAWSNLCKIGTIRGNPSDVLAMAQKEVAVRILKAEIKFLRPSLIVCAAENTAYDEFFYEALDTTRGEDGFTAKPFDDSVLYFRARVPPYPPILWMRHPQFRPAAYLKFAEAEALSLLETDSK